MRKGKLVFTPIKQLLGNLNQIEQLQPPSTQFGLFEEISGQ